MKRTIASLLLSILCILPAFADDDVNREKREADEFSVVEAAKGLNIILVQCDHYGLEVVTQGCPTSDVETTVKKGRLVAKMKKRTPGSAVSVFVYFKDIEAAYVKTGASIETHDGCHLERRGSFLLDVAAKCEAEMDFDVDELVVSSNSCLITVSGKAVKQKVEMSGTVQDSKYDASSLWSEDVEIYASGCDSEIYATKSVKAEAVGCTITCKGGAEVEKTASFGGDVVISLKINDSLHKESLAR